ncbi:hypothetical protein KM043_006113 [Ampulex compressa]|nr:hypothetical protein KM043_006113 [Ampulex compressa]
MPTRQADRSILTCRARTSRIGRTKGESCDPAAPPPRPVPPSARARVAPQRRWLARGKAADPALSPGTPEKAPRVSASGVASRRRPRPPPHRADTPRPGRPRRLPGRWCRAGKGCEAKERGSAHTGSGLSAKWPADLELRNRSPCGAPRRGATEAGSPTLFLWPPTLEGGSPRARTPRASSRGSLERARFVERRDRRLGQNARPLFISYLSFPSPPPRCPLPLGAGQISVSRVGDRPFELDVERPPAAESAALLDFRAANAGGRSESDRCPLLDYASRYGYPLINHDRFLLLDLGRREAREIERRKVRGTPPAKSWMSKYGIRWR